MIHPNGAKIPQEAGGFPRDFVRASALTWPALDPHDNASNTQ